MTTSTNTRQGTSAQRTAKGGMGNANSSRQAWIDGGVITGAMLLVLAGVFHFFVGIAAFSRSNYYSAAANYPYALSSRSWGWVHVIAGVILAITGVALLTGSRIARALALVFLGLSAIANFFFIPFQPLWAFLILAVDVFAIWAISSAKGRGSLSGEQPSTGAMGARQQAAMQAGTQPYQGAYQPAGTAYQQGAMAGMGSGQNQSAYQQGDQRWPQNVQGRDQQGRQYAAGNMKAPDSMGGRSAEQMRDQAREQASQYSGGQGQQGQNAQQAGDRARRGDQGS
jgi:hypothetical protein